MANQYTKPRPSEFYFWAKVDKKGLNDCWLWKGADTQGYGHFKTKGKYLLAHRFAYETIVGLIPAGLTLDHLCRQRACVNPLHLEPVTRGENVLRGIGRSARNARKTHCIRGHPFDEAN